MSLPIKASLRREILDRYGWRCVYCLKKVEGRRAQIDHVIPTSRGGGHCDHNMVASCRHCNLSKKDRPLSEWMPEMNLRGCTACFDPNLMRDLMVTKVTLRLTPSEREAIAAAAKREDRREGEWIRRAALAALERRG